MKGFTLSLSPSLRGRKNPRILNVLGFPTAEGKTLTREHGVLVPQGTCGTTTTALPESWLKKYDAYHISKSLAGTRGRVWSEHEVGCKGKNAMLTSEKVEINK